MTEPVTTLKTLIVPNTGDLTGAWGTSALNPNFQLIDTMFGGVATISLGAATSITLSVPATTGIWAGTNPQSSQAMIRFTGTQSGDATITFTLPGFYIIDNKCTAGNFQIVLVGGGDQICAPPNRKTTIFYDGTDVDYVDLGEGPGSSLDLAGWTTIPRWIQGCTFQPYLLKNGSSHSTAVYPHLAYALAGSFGNTNPVGVSFFLPDEMARVRVGYDSVGTGRMTNAICGIEGTTMGANGGSQSMQSHQHANALVDPGHRHGGGDANGGAGIIVNGGSAQPFIINGNTGTATTGISITNATTGAGSSQNAQPSTVSALPLIKT